MTPARRERLEEIGCPCCGETLYSGHAWVADDDPRAHDPTYAAVHCLDDAGEAPRHRWWVALLFTLDGTEDYPMVLQAHFRPEPPEPHDDDA
jgi:hypothetical protein